MTDPTLHLDAVMPQLTAEVRRLQVLVQGGPAPDGPDQSGWSAVYRTGGLTTRDYDETIRDLTAAREAVATGDDSRGCAVCGDSGHGVATCHHNALVLARRHVAAQALFRCYHCGFEATTEAEAVEHFGRSEAEVARCLRDHPAERHRDEIDAWQSAMPWLERIGAALHAEYPASLIERAVWQGGGIAILWHRDKLIATVTVIRDSMNWSVVLRWEAA